MKIAFLGLGVMGYPMAGHLSRRGYEVTVYNRSTDKARKWLESYSGEFADTPAKASRGKDYIFCCVGDDPDVDEVMLGPDGVLEGLGKGANSVIVDHTTTSAELARRLYAQCNEHNISFIDAPVSGGETGAIKGILTCMCGGDFEPFSRVKPVIESYTANCRHMGASGSGQLTKMVNQLCIAGLVQGLAEGLNLGQRAGLDMDAVLGVISKGAAQSWQMENRAKTMCLGEYDFGFAVDWMRKDLRICQDEAKRLKTRVPVAELVDSFYEKVQQAGGGRWDTSSLMYLLTENKTV